MKSRKSIAVSILYILLVSILLCGCGAKNKQPISAQKFAEKLMAAGYTVNDNTDNVEEHNFLRSYRAVNSDESIVLFFSETKSAEYAESLYNAEKNLMWKQADKKFLKAKKNFFYANAYCSDEYYVFSAVEGTYLSCKSPKSQAEELNSLVSILGY